MRTGLSIALVVPLLLGWGCAHSPTPQPSSIQQGTPKWRELRLPSGDIRLSVPEEWKVARNEPAGTGDLVLIDIPFPAAAGTPHQSQLVLSTISDEAVVDIRKYVAWSLRDVFANDPASILAGALDGNFWMTVLSRAHQDGLEFAVIDRFGVWQGQMANLRVVIPLFAHAPLSWFETTISQINAVIRSFSMGGENMSTSEFVVEEGSLVLRSRNPDRPLNSPFTFEARGILLGGSPSAK